MHGTMGGTGAAAMPLRRPPSSDSIGGLGKTSGMSQEDVDRQTKQRIKEERRQQQQQQPSHEPQPSHAAAAPRSRRITFDDVSRASVTYQKAKASGASQEELDRRMKQHLKDERRRQQEMAGAAGATAMKRPPSCDGLSDAGKTSGMSQEELDRQTKQRIKEERRMLNEQQREQKRQDDPSQPSHGAAEARRKFAERLQARALAGEPDDEEEKAPIEEEDDLAEDERRGEDRRKSRHRHSHRRGHGHRKSERRHRDSQVSVASSRSQVSEASHASRESNDGVERRRQQRRDREEEDRRLKDQLRRERDADRERQKERDRRDVPQASPGNDLRYEDEIDEIEEIERRMRRRREQEKEDQRLIEALRRQRQRTQSSMDETPSNGKTSTGNWLSDVTIDENEACEESMARLDSFEAALAQEGGLCKPISSDQERRAAAEADDEAQVRQSLIDLHIAQFRATTKISVGDDSADGELGEAADGGAQGSPGILDPRASVEEFMHDAAQRNLRRRESRRVSVTTLAIKAWQEKYSLKKALQLAERTPGQEWARSFYRCDPRWQIMKFFNEVAQEGGEAPMDENLAASPLANLFDKANVFTVWRPTSDEAICNMMLGVATGKGLDIKGKSAKRGNISSYVPFIQIFEEPHKLHVRELIKDGRVVRVFYRSESARSEAHEMILDIKDFMLFAAEDAMRVLSDEFADEAEQELAMKHLMYDDTNLAVDFVDEYAFADPPVFGLDITERLFWESYVINQNCARPAGTEWDIGRGSELTFMDMNFKAIRHAPPPGDPRAVVYQFSTESPMEPRTLLMAYEECGRVKPVVSDFDCFLLGSRGVKYKNPIPPEQLDLVKWSVKNISEVLDERAESASTAGWMETWFKVLKKAAQKGYYPKTPKYGNGDPKSYEIIKVAVERLQKTGCVRHGAECFNWFFPQEIDDQFLVVSDTLPGNLKWKKVNVQQLQDLLISKIGEGFTFPINPKWVLCDPGWRRVYDTLLASQRPNVQDSIKCWLPPGTGLREEVDAISERHPLGFEGARVRKEGTEEMDRLEDDLERYFKIQRLWRKVRLFLYWIRFVREKHREIKST